MNREINYEQKKLLDKSENALMIGRLSEERSIHATGGGGIRFLVEPLCAEPIPVTQCDALNQYDYENGSEYSSFDTHQGENGLPMFYDKTSFDVDTKIEEMYHFLDNKLIIFSPEYTYSKNEQKYYKNLVIDFLVDDNITNFHYFHVIPRLDIDNYIFEQQLKKGEYFELTYYDADLYDSPEIIICGNYAYINKNNHDLVVYNENNLSRWKCNDYSEVVKVNISQFSDSKVLLIKCDEYMYFMEDALRNQILTSDSCESIEEVVVKKEVVEANKQSEFVEEDEIDVDEINFIKALNKLTMNSGLLYEEEDLINFHTSVKTNALTILAGMSGTGKTQLAYNYAKMLNLSEDNNTLLFMPISPSYTEPSDVLGYLNSMNGLYVPSETGLVQFLQHAQNNTEQMHMVIFDEMNLSQIEYWFSPFISILEKDLNDRYIKLYDEDAHCINTKVYPYRLKINENVIFIGTVNIDETTKDFSNRLLDRTFVINLQKSSFVKFKSIFKATRNDSVVINTAKCTDVSGFSKWRKGSNTNYMSAFAGHDEELEFLDELDSCITKSLPDSGISYRVLKNIANYINNIPCDGSGNPVLERSVIFDTIINQTVLTKIRGTETQLFKLVGHYNLDKSIIEDSEIIELLNRYSQISGFEKTRKSIERKVKELSINGYTN